MQLQEIISSIQSYHPSADISLIRKAHAFAMDHHKGQTRVSGEPFITHVMEVAFLASKLKLDSASIAAALLHDTVEDTDVTLQTIEEEFGQDVSAIVDGVTKLSQVNFSSRAEAQSENFRKMLLAMAKDIRVLMIKLCDRMHNMRTLEFLSESRRTRIAQETLDIYAPLAHRLGIYWAKSEFEDLSLRYIKPEIYENIKKHVRTTKKERHLYTKEVVKLISEELEKNGIKGDVSGRPKHFFSIYQKMERQDVNFDEIFDLIAFRILVSSTMDCYAALGIIHAAWKPIPGRFKDYIAMPKPNQYQSLHSTIIGPSGLRVEIQIRTPDMHDVAERGIAAHWKYKSSKDGTTADVKDSFQLPWLKDLIESERLLSDPIEFLSMVKEDLFPEEVFVFSPKGDLTALPKGSTPIDFAYEVHTEVGTHCTGARISGRQVPLNYKLRNGDTVEIITSDSQTPSKDWLTMAVSAKAKQRIRSWTKAEERKRSISIGRELLGKDLRKVKLTLGKVLKDGTLQKVAEQLGFQDYDLLLAEIGYGKTATKTVVSRLVPDITDLEDLLVKQDSALQRIFQKAAQAFKDTAGIKVNGLDDVVFRFAKCCEPLPGDELLGYITRGRGVTIHARGCTQALSFDPRRLVPVTWDEKAKTVRPIMLKVYCIDRVGMLASLTQSISESGANILGAQVGNSEDGKAVCNFEINVESSKQLALIRRKIEGVNGVIRVARAKKA